MKKVIIGIVIGILLSGVIVYATTNYMAREISYKNTTVEYALNDLYEKSSTSSNNDYSNEETIIGTWIDGKTIYRSIYIGEVTAVSQDIFAVEDKIDALIDLYGYFINPDLYKFPFNFTQKDSSQAAAFLKPDGKTFAYRGSNIGTYYIVIEYTKE